MMSQSPVCAKCVPLELEVRGVGVRDIEPVEKGRKAMCPMIQFDHEMLRSNQLRVGEVTLSVHLDSPFSGDKHCKKTAI